MGNYLDERLRQIDATAAPIHRALVLGATGLLGGAVVRELIGRGIPVRALKRWNSRTAHLGELEGRVDWVVGDVNDVASVERAAMGCDVLFHAAAYYPTVSTRPRDTLRRAVTGMRAVLEVARERGLSRVVYVSSPSTIGPPTEGAEATEADRYLPGSVDDPYYQAKHFMELEALRAAGSGLPVVVVNPTLCLGPDDPKPTSGRLVLEYASGRMPVVPRGTVNVVDTRDAARSIVEAAIRGREGARYILGGWNVTLRQLADAVASQAGARSPRLEVPGEVLIGASRVTEHLATWVTRRPPLLPLHGVHMLVLGSPLSSQRAVNELGHSARPLEDTLRDAIADLRLRGRLPTARA